MKRVFIAMFVLSATGALVGQGGPERLLDARCGDSARGAQLASIYYSGRGSTFNFGQAVSATAPGPARSEDLRGRHSPHDAGDGLQAYRTNRTAPRLADFCSSNTSAKTWRGTWRRSRTARNLGRCPRLAVDLAVRWTRTCGRAAAGGPPPEVRPRVDLSGRCAASGRAAGERRPPAAGGQAGAGAGRRRARQCAVVADAEVRRAFPQPAPRRPIVARRSG